MDFSVGRELLPKCNRSGDALLSLCVVKNVSISASAARVKHFLSRVFCFCFI